MIYVDEYRDTEAVRSLSERIADLARHTGPLAFMEVCGTHTMCAARYGIRSLLPEGVRLISGPGCPVCVTPNRYLDRAIAISRLERTVLTTFGDMFRVPGSTSSLSRERSGGADIRVIYSPLESLEIASRNPEKTVVFLGIGFETTAPAVAATVLEAQEDGLDNYFLLSGHKTIPEVMEMLAGSPDLDVDGFICPGHVSAVIGSDGYRTIAEEHTIPCVIAGFEPVDMLQAVYMLLRQAVEGRSVVENQYRRVVAEKGNERAFRMMKKVFDREDSEWRGIGLVERSGLSLRKELQEFDARMQIEVEVEKTREFPGCICGEILKGVKIPTECCLFGAQCTPLDPKGACMVSTEGACAAYYKYRDIDDGA